MGIIIAFTLLISPVAGMIGGGVLLFLRSGGIALFNNFSSVMLNESTSSQNRATTISTFNMIKNIPYALGAIVIGYGAELYSATFVASALGVLLLLLLFLQFKYLHKNS